MVTKYGIYYEDNSHYVSSVLHNLVLYDYHSNLDLDSVTYSLVSTTTNKKVDMYLWKRTNQAHTSTGTMVSLTVIVVRTVV